MGVRTKDYFLLAMEIDFYEHPRLKELGSDEQFKAQYEGLANPWKHEAGMMVHLFDEDTGILTVGYTLAVKGESDDTLGCHVLSEQNQTAWRSKYEPLVNAHVETEFAVTGKAEFKLLTYFW